MTGIDFPGASVLGLAGPVQVYSDCLARCKHTGTGWPGASVLGLLGPVQVYWDWDWLARSECTGTA